MALRKLVAGNWKMNGDLTSIAEAQSIAQAAKGAEADVALCVPATLIAPVAAAVSGIGIGGQDCHWAQNGAHTGCISVSMLKEAGAGLVIVGHSERRTDNGETSEQVAMKAAAATAGGLTSIICVGETEAERDAGRAVEIVTAQVALSVPAASLGRDTVVAYEPVWAIGTGRTPSSEDVAEMHAAIRTQLIEQLGQEGAAIRILYGGSVKPSNAAELLHIPDVDGALVGGASLKAADFIPIITAAGGAH